jgi:hypothetical protein
MLAVSINHCKLKIAIERSGGNRLPHSITRLPNCRSVDLNQTRLWPRNLKIYSVLAHQALSEIKLIAFRDVAIVVSIRCLLLTRQRTAAMAAVTAAVRG